MYLARLRSIFNIPFRSLEGMLRPLAIITVIKSLGIEVSPSYVSSLASRLDKTVNEFLERKIDGEYSG